MKTLQRIHTLNELIQLIHAMPASAFDDDDGIYAVRKAMDVRRSDWIASDEYANQIYAEDKKLKERQKKDTQRLAEREETITEMLAHGRLVRGMFLKVTGARDGHGIREFLELSPSGNRLVCRQWWPIRKTQLHNHDLGQCKRMDDGTWVHSVNQITEHDFCRVAKILTTSVLG